MYEMFSEVGGNEENYFVTVLKQISCGICSLLSSFLTTFYFNCLHLNTNTLTFSSSHSQNRLLTSVLMHLRRNYWLFSILRHSLAAFPSSQGWFQPIVAYHAKTQRDKMTLKTWRDRSWHGETGTARKCVQWQRRRRGWVGLQLALHRNGW